MSILRTFILIGCISILGSFTASKPETKQKDVFKNIAKRIFKVMQKKTFDDLDKLTPSVAILEEVLRNLPERDKEPYKDYSPKQLEQQIKNGIKKQVKRLHKDAEEEGNDFSKISLLRVPRPRVKTEKGFKQAEGRFTIDYNGNFMTIRYHVVKYKKTWYLMRMWY